jgi:hypothetical protein
MNGKIPALLASLLLSAGAALAQLPMDSVSQKIVFKQLISVDPSAKAEALYKAGRVWFATTPKVLNPSNAENNSDALTMLSGARKGDQSKLDQLYKNENPLKSEDPEDKRLAGLSTIKYTGGKFTCVRIMYLQYNIKVAFKDGKARFEATDFTYNHYNQQTVEKQQLYGFSDKGVCGSSNTLENLLKCDKCSGELTQLQAYVAETLDKQVASLKAAMESGSKAEENW